MPDPRRWTERQILVARIVGGGLCFISLIAVLVLQPVLPGATLLVWDRPETVEVTLPPTPTTAVAGELAQGVAQAVEANVPTVEPVTVAELPTAPTPTVLDDPARIQEPEAVTVPAAHEEPAPIEPLVPLYVSVAADGYVWRHVRGPDGTEGWLADAVIGQSSAGWRVETGGPVAMLRTAPSLSAPAVRALHDGVSLSLVED
jgi:hypothetical protein